MKKKLPREKHTETRSISVRLTRKQIIFMDCKIKEEGFDSRSEFIRALFARKMKG